MEVMDVLGFFYIPQDGVEASLPLTAAASALGCYDAFRFGSPSGQEEIFVNHKLLQRSYLIAGPAASQQLKALISAEPQRIQPILQQGFHIAERFKESETYDHRWPSAYGLEAVIQAQGGTANLQELLP